VDALLATLREGLTVAGVLCLPVLTVATAVGLAVAIAAAATQIQEQTLSLLPKMLAVVICTALFGQFALGLCARLFQDAIAAIPAIVAAGP